MLSASTLFWVFGPMLGIILLSVVTYFTERSEQ